ncbi:cache domain-containing sensor histidine kinase [Cohnella endophytica]|nr:sensor histidine kinase [Cohnella endophytica]
MQLPGFYRNWPIHIKLMGWIIPLLVVTIGLTGAFSYYIASRQALSKASLTHQHFTRKIVDEFNYIAQDALDFSNFLFLSESVQDLLQEPTAPNVWRRTFSSLSTLMVTRNTIQSLIIYPMNKDNVATGEPFAIDQSGLTSAMPFERFKLTTLYTAALQGRGTEAWGYSHARDQLFIGDREDKIVLVKVIKNANDLSSQAILVMGIQEKRLRARLMDTLEDNTDIIVIDKGGTVMTGTEPEWIGRPYGAIPYPELHAPLERLPMNIGSDKRLISHDFSPFTGWHVFVVQPKRLLLKELDQISIITIAFVSLCLIAAIFLSWFGTTLITKPMRKLLKSMRLLQNGDFTQRVQFATRDEIGQLGHGYNVMVRRIEELINDVYDTKLKQKEAELKTLQEQINPHFLYNTLDMIYWSARKQQENELSEMVYALSRMFRLRLNNGQSMITLEQELELVRHYLHLQRYRFKDRFAYEIRASPEQLELLIPKLLIQPLVENAFLHGIEPLNEGGLIQVACDMDDSCLRIQVIDNGSGISARRLQLLNGDNQDAKPGFALKNIQERLLLAYGDEAALLIESTEGRGTLVTLRIPRTGAKS